MKNSWSLGDCCENENKSQTDQKYSQDVDLTMTYIQNM